MKQKQDNQRCLPAARASPTFLNPSPSFLSQKKTAEALSSQEKMFFSVDKEDYRVSEALTLPGILHYRA